MIILVSGGNSLNHLTRLIHRLAQLLLVGSSQREELFVGRNKDGEKEVVLGLGGDLALGSCEPGARHDASVHQLLHLSVEQLCQLLGDLCLRLFLKGSRSVGHYQVLQLGELVAI